MSCCPSFSTALDGARFDGALDGVGAWWTTSTVMCTGYVVARQGSAWWWCTLSWLSLSLTLSLLSHSLTLSLVGVQSKVVLRGLVCVRRPTDCAACGLDGAYGALRRSSAPRSGGGSTFLLLLLSCLVSCGPSTGDYYLQACRSSHALLHAHVLFCFLSC